MDRHYDKLNDSMPDPEKEKNMKLQALLKKDASNELERSMRSSNTGY